MMTSTGPTLRLRQLSRELTKLRKDAGVSREAAAHALGQSVSKIGHIETTPQGRRNLLSRADLKVLLDLYGVRDRYEDLDQLREEAHTKGWWAMYRLRDPVHTYIGFENDAIRADRFTFELVPGALQTEAYAQELAVVSGDQDDPEMQRHIAARLERGQRLRDGLLILNVVMSEAALRRTVHMTSGEGQLKYLLEASDLQNVTIRVIPFSCGGHHSMTSSFTVLTFDPEMMDPVAYIDGGWGGNLVEEQKVVAPLQKAFKQNWAQALEPLSTAMLIEQFIEKKEDHAG